MYHVGRKKKTPRCKSRGLQNANPDELEKTLQELVEVCDVDGSKTRGGTIAVAAFIEPVVAGVDHVKRRVRALVSLAGESQSVERVVEEPQARAVQRLAE